MKFARIAIELLLCVSSSRLSYATKRDDMITTTSSTATTPGSNKKTAALRSAVVPVAATTQSDDTGHLVIVPNNRNDNKDKEQASLRSYPSSLTYSNALVGRGESKDNSLVDTASRALSTSGEDWIAFGNNTDTLVGDFAGDEFGWSTALSGDGLTLAAGARYNDNNGPDTGHVKIFRKVDNSWSQLGGDIRGEAALDHSGYSVSLSDDGNIVAIGAVYNDENGDLSGHVRIFSYNTTAWVKLGQNINGEAAQDRSGISVSLSGNGETVAIGANDNVVNGDRSGHVRVYNYNTTSWVQLGEDIDGKADDDKFGTSVSLSDDGDTVAIGAPINDKNGNDSGHVEVYTYNSTSWVQLGSAINGEAVDDLFGFSVSLSGNGNTVAIGARDHEGNGFTDSGHVKVYTYNSTSWVQLGSAINGESATEHSGISVSLSDNGDTVAIGAFGNDEGSGANSGRVRVYGLNDTSWVKLGDDIDGEAGGDVAGHSVSLSGDGSIVAFGAHGNDAYGINSGSVRVYTRPASVLTASPSSSPTSSPSSSPTQINHENKATVREFYIDSLDNIQEEATSHDIIHITLPFNTSNRTHGARVFTENCTTEFDTNHIYFEADTSNPISSVDDGYIQFNTTVDMNITALNGTAYWNSFTDGSRGGWAEVCVETYLSLTSPGNTDEEVDFVNNVLNVSVSLNGDFTVEDISVQRENVTKSSSVLDYSGFVEAYQCDRDSPRDRLTSPPLYTQGDNLVICVKDNDQGIIQVEDIKDLVISQSGTASYNYVVDNLSNPDITSITCQDGDATQGTVCIAELTLLSRFFPEVKPADLTVTGVVDVVRGGYTPSTSNRALRMAKQDIAEESVAALRNIGSGGRGLEQSSGGFNLKVKVGTDDADTSGGSNQYAGSAGLLSVALGAAGAALLV